MAMTGLMLPAELATPAQYAFQGSRLQHATAYRELDFDTRFFERTRRTGVPVWHVGAGANMAFRRDAFDRVGLFDERLGAGTSGCSEDSELWYRLLAEGHVCRYTPHAVVFHHHRADWEELREQLYNYMRGHVAALFFQFDRYGHWGNMYRALAALPAYFLRTALLAAKRTLGRKLYTPQTVTPVQPLGPQIRGTLAGYAYYLRHRRAPAFAAADSRHP
jgi:GT2 family glycosyltransferase